MTPAGTIISEIRLCAARLAVMENTVKGKFWGLDKYSTLHHHNPIILFENNLFEMIDKCYNEI